MKKTIILFLLLLLSNMIFSITVDGYAYLENQTTHDNIKVVFDRSVPSSLTDSTYTDSNGYYTINIEIGIYDISYSKENYHHYTKYDEVLYSSTTLMDVTILGSFATINVPSYISTIQEAIDFSWDGDTILVQPGTYVENINFNGKNIILGSLFLTTQDTSYISQTIIDGSGNQNNRVVIFENNEDSTAVLTGFTITNGNNGGIICSYSSPTLNYLRIIGNTAYNNNSGGGIYFSYSQSMLSNLTITDNTAQYGAGIFCNDSELELSNLFIVGNNLVGGGFSFSGSGGGIASYGSTLIVSNCNISYNVGTGSTLVLGGGIFSNSSSFSLNNVIISHNSVTSTYNNGGGIYSDDGSFISIDYSTILNNIADYGAGIYCYNNSSLNLTNVTVSGNTADYGGGIYFFNSYPILVNSILWNNTPQEIYINFGSVTATYSDIQGGWTGIGNIDADPLFADPQNDDFHLTWANFPIPDSTMSPCIDAGDPNSPFDPDSTIADMGAFYFDQNQQGVEDISILKLSNILYQNFPNPFNPTTTISFFTTENNEKNTDLVIYNLKGQKVKTLVNEVLPAGEHSVVWNGDDDSGKKVSSGIYFYQLKVGKDFSETKKMLLLR